jgi:hypothetical protein
MEGKTTNRLKVIRLWKAKVLSSFYRRKKPCIFLGTEHFALWKDPDPDIL